jgi:uncharacterized protein with NAD-binding domain and iron-sulfur cluster
MGATGWTPWLASFSTNRMTPGDPGAGGPLFGPEMMARSALLLRDFYGSLTFGAHGPGDVRLSAAPAPPTGRRPGATLHGVVATLLTTTNQLLLLAAQEARRLTGPAGAAALDDAFAPLLGRLAPMLSRDPAARRLHALADLVRGLLVGMTADRLWDERREAYDAINHLEFRDWLSRHGVQPASLRSPMIRGQYDLVFSLRDGDPRQPMFSAGWGVLLSARLWFDYKGAIFWKMRAGMGDVVFAPLYQALAARGVGFRFLTSVTGLTPDATGSVIEAVAVRGAPLAPGLAEYRPLTTVRGLPCYPATVDADQLASAGEDARQEAELRLGRDFDLLVLAIPPAAQREICGPVMAQRRRWRDMVDGVGSVATHAFQVWLRPVEADLGWAHPGVTMSGFAKPFDTYAAMSHVADLEDWGATGTPGTVGYFCSTLPREAGTGTAADAYTHDRAVEFLGRHGGSLWPGATDPHTGDFRWDLLAGSGAGHGAERFDGQYWTANTDPSDRYVQSLPGTDAFRIQPDRSGYRNLVLAGDWTDCGINAGCIEAAVVSGLQAANALLGRPRWDGLLGALLRS